MNKTIQILKDRQKELSSRATSGEEHEEMIYLESAISSAIRFQREREKAAHIEKAKSYLAGIGIKIACDLVEGSHLTIFHNEEAILSVEDVEII